MVQSWFAWVGRQPVLWTNAYKVPSVHLPAVQTRLQHNKGVPSAVPSCSAISAASSPNRQWVTPHIIMVMVIIITINIVIARFSCQMQSASADRLHVAGKVFEEKSEVCRLLDSQDPSKTQSTLSTWLRICSAPQMRGLVCHQAKVILGHSLLGHAPVMM